MNKKISIGRLTLGIERGDGGFILQGFHARGGMVRWASYGLGAVRVWVMWE